LLTSTANIIGNSITFTASSSTGLLITMAQTSTIFKGMPITFSTVSGVLPTGLAANTIYYVTADDSFNGTTAFHVSTTFANAMAGTAISYTNSGTAPNIVSLAPAGALEGEYAHTQLTAEVGAHNHTGTVAIGQSGTGSSGSGISGTTSGPLSLTISNNSPAGTPFNVTQPGTLMNVFIKL
jgi:hypothetical protein